jgi:hypothetical protein
MSDTEKPIEELQPGEALDLCERFAAIGRLARLQGFDRAAAWERLARALAARIDSFAVRTSISSELTGRDLRIVKSILAAGRSADGSPFVVDKDGWPVEYRVVPYEPTRAMLTAWHDRGLGVFQYYPSTRPGVHWSDSEARYVACYKAMVDAAPKTKIEPCIYEARSRDGRAYAGSEEVWCRVHGFDCPNTSVKV